MPSSSSISIDLTAVRRSATEVAKRCDVLAQYSESPFWLTRTFCSEAMKGAHEEVRHWMNAAGMNCHVDAVGNLIGSSPFRSNQSAPAEIRDVFMIGSHLDTVVNAGRFDGVLGVLLGLAVVEVINESNLQLPFDIDVVAFSEEEGVRFGFPFIGSRGIAGTFDPADFDRTDRNGITVREALTNFGCDPHQLASASYRGMGSGTKLVGFMEAHLEQATRLETAQSPVGMVSGIAGQTRASIALEGMSGHAGTVLHDQRTDALAAAAKLILDIEQLGQQTDGLFATVGSVSAKPGLANVISGQVELLLDLRHESDDVRMSALHTISMMIRELKKLRGVAGRIHSQCHTSAVPMDPTLSRYLRDAIKSANASTGTLVSGAGHDAMVMANAAPSCMLFIRCRDGVSHHPDEYVSHDDIYTALEVMTNAICQFANAYNATVS